MKYRKKPVEVEAFQFGVDENPEWFKDYHIEDFDTEIQTFVHTLEGVLRVDIGDMIIKGVIGEIYPCNKDIFDKYYDRVEERKPFKYPVIGS